MTKPWNTLALLAAIAMHGTALAESHPEHAPLLVLLHETSELRDGLPVLTVHTDATEVAEQLSRGLPGTMLRLYRYEQFYLHGKRGSAVEPAYVLLSERQGGFARQGFFLDDVEKRDTGYVDVKASWPVAGRFGALDQLVPHELFHVIYRQLAGELDEGYTNQVHAIGVRTDRQTALNEGFAEHLQAIAIEHADADPETRALAEDESRYERALDRLNDYQLELTARFAVATRLRMGFLAWYSNDEDVLRYFAVRDNAFARDRSIPDRLLESKDPYHAYLIENILPGDASGAAKSVSRMLASEGVVASLFHRWANSEELRRRYRDEAFYAQFGTTSAEVSPLENVYLKLFHAMFEHKPSGTDELIAGYRRSFPDEDDAVVDLVTESLLGQAPEVPPEIWLVGRELRTGTTVFDQFRGLPREHTFDLNAASLVDLISVPGLDRHLARVIQDHGPYESIDALGQVPGVGEELVGNFRKMRILMESLLASAEDESVEDVISIRTIIMPFVVRASLALLAAFVLGSLLYRAVRSWDPVSRPSRLRSGFNGFAAALIALVAGWAFAAAGGAAVVAVAVLCGVPSALWRWWRTRRASAAAWALLAWLAAAMPAAVIVTPVG